MNRSCLSKTWLYAGNSEHPALLVFGSVTMRPVRTISREVAHSWVDPSETTRQGPFLVGKIWSVLHGDMQRPTEMIGPLGFSPVNSGKCN